MTKLNGRECYNFISDSGHGWLAVKKSHITELNLQDSISRFSYVKNNIIYLEEDCDANKFIQAYKNRFGYNPDYCESVVDGQSKIRRYEAYTQ